MFNTPTTISIQQVTAEEAKQLMKNKEIVSAIGHQATTDIMNLLLDANLTTNRIQVKLSKGDEAIVFGLAKRLEEGKVLRTVEEISQIGYSLYYLKVI
jgi:transcriptional regulator CtsR